MIELLSQFAGGVLAAAAEWFRKRAMSPVPNEARTVECQIRARKDGIVKLALDLGEDPVLTAVAGEAPPRADESVPITVQVRVQPGRTKWWRRIASVALTFLLFSLGYWRTQIEDWYKHRDKSEYGFEQQNSAWMILPSAEAGRALSNVRIVSPGLLGDGAMAVDVDLNGAKGDGWDRGEVFVDVRSKPPVSFPAGVSALDLSNKRVRATVDIPDSRLVGRDAGKPLFLQMFFRKCDDPEIVACPDKARDILLSGRHLLECGPDPLRQRVCQIGIKIGMNPADRNAYRGTMYVDMVGW